MAIFLLHFFQGAQIFFHITVLRLGNHACVIAIFADVLVPIWLQDISNHHADSTDDWWYHVNHVTHYTCTCHVTTLTYWGRVMHIYLSKLTITCSDNGLAPDRHQAVICTNAGILLIGTLGTNASEMLIEILTFSLKKCLWKCRQLDGGHFVSASMC